MSAARWQQLRGEIVNPNGWTEDHVWPRSAGYGRTQNTVLAHRACNVKKGDRWPTEDEARTARHLLDGIPLDVARYLP